jgi:hypothetical protein
MSIIIGGFAKLTREPRINEEMLKLNDAVLKFFQNENINAKDTV